MAPDGGGAETRPAVRRQRLSASYSRATRAAVPRHAAVPAAARSGRRPAGTRCSVRPGPAPWGIRTAAAPSSARGESWPAAASRPARPRHSRASPARASTTPSRASGWIVRRSNCVKRWSTAPRNGRNSSLRRERPAASAGQKIAAHESVALPSSEPMRISSPLRRRSLTPALNTITSRGSSRLGSAAQNIPAGRWVAMSLRECTVKSTSPRNSAASSVSEKKSGALTCDSGVFRSRSPCVSMRSSETRRSGLKTQAPERSAGFERQPARSPGCRGADAVWPVSCAGEAGGRAGRVRPEQQLRTLGAGACARCSCSERTFSCRSRSSNR